MTNIMDYMDWRGDITFASSPFNKIDALIMSQIIYIPFEGVVPSKRSTRTITMEKAADKFFSTYDEKTSSLGAVIPHEIYELFRKAGKCERFKNMILTRYENKVDYENEVQFSAFTAIIPDTNEYIIAYRGTDDTIVGWKEDFNMSFMDEVPSQMEAVKYLEYVVDKCVSIETFPQIYLTGHSKGGNLAVYAAAFVENDGVFDIKESIKAIYNNDGPGFCEKILKSQEYSDIKDKIQTIIPQSSIVGMLLGHEENYTIVKSNQHGLLQHDAFTWEVVGKEFIYVEQVTGSSRVLDKTLKDWLKGMDKETAQKFVNALFGMLNATDETTLTGLMAGKNKSLAAMMKAYADEDEETKKMLKAVIKSMVDILKTNMVPNKRIEGEENGGK